MKREFWLTENKEYEYWSAHDTEQYDDDIHVIEYAAFEELQEQAARAIVSFQWITNNIKMSVEQRVRLGDAIADLHDVIQKHQEVKGD